MGRKIVFFSTPAYGHIIPEYAAIKMLVSMGFSVKWYATERFGDIVLSSGAQYERYIGNFEEEYDLKEMTENFYNLLSSLSGLNQKYYCRYADKIDDDVSLILYDSMCSFAKNIAIKRKIKYICLSAVMAYNFASFAFSNMLLPSVLLFMRYGKEISEIIKAENKFRKENGLPDFKMLDFFVNRGMRTVVFTPPEFQPFCATFPGSFKFVGTTIGRRAEIYGYAKKSLSSPDGFGTAHNAEIGECDIFVTLGTICTENKELLRKITESEFIKSRKTVVNIGNADMVSPCKNVVFINYADQLKLLKKCKMMICHGGLNTVYEGIYCGVLLVCIPQQEEMRMTAKIIQKKGLGIYLKDFDEKKVKTLYEKRESYMDNIIKYAKIIQTADGAKSAADAVCEVLEHG